MNDDSIKFLMIFGLVSDTLVGCATKALPPSREEDPMALSAPPLAVSDCEPPAMCAAWMACTEECEAISWQDVESNACISDDMSFDGLRELCLSKCDANYIGDIFETECDHNF